ncbi:MAG: RelA/SpoT domain-containing protein [Actinomycetota bacterium]|nr:RelA/SpoT domain-containing protein [Actinomycetota bacterium]
MNVQPRRIRTDYEKRLPLLEGFRESTVFVVARELRLSRVEYLRVESRVKELKSIIEKAERKGVSDPLDAFDDIVGLRVVTYLKRDIETVKAAMASCLDVIKIDDKVNELPTPENFDYQAIHLTFRLRDHYKGPHYDDFKGMVGELQIRSAAMDAWAVVAHGLAYRSDQELPPELRRKLAAVSAGYYMADEALDDVANASDALREDWERAIAEADLAAVGVNTLSLTEYLSLRLSARRVTDAAIVAGIASELACHGYATMDQVEASLGFGLKAAEALESDRLAREERTAPYSAGPFLLLAVNLADVEFASRHGEDVLVRERDQFAHLVKD